MTTTSRTAINPPASFRRSRHGRLRRSLSRGVGSSNIAAGDVLLAILATAIGYLAVTSDGVKPAGGTAAGIAMLAVGLPVLSRRPMPVAGLAVLLAVDLVSIAIFGEHTRCGAVLPVAGYLTFTACRRARGTAELLLPLCLAAAIGAATCAFEVGPGGILPCVLLFGGCAVAARVVRRRDIIAEQLDRESRALEAQRDQTARLAVETERARIGADLTAGVEGHVDMLLQHAQSGRRAPDAREAMAAFAAIEQESRAGLSHMRTVVDELYPATVEPQPSLEELDRLLASRRAHASVGFEGARQALEPDVELAACRIVELLLQIVDPGDAGVQVRVLYAAGALEVELVAHGSGDDVDPGVLAAARARARAVGGSIDLRTHGSRTRAHVQLPAGAGA
jgi:signal transduction histidine kinase